MSENITELLAEKVIEFNSRVDNEPKFSKMIEGKNRTICICVLDGDHLLFAKQKVIYIYIYIYMHVRFILYILLTSTVTSMCH